MIRAFIGIDAPVSLRNTIADLQRDLRVPGVRVRWEKPENFHVTMKFLGDTTREILEEMAEALREKVSRVPVLAFQADTIGAFPSRSRPRVIWLGSSAAPDEIFSLQRTIEEEAAKFGFEPEQRRFHPHITLGRVKDRDGLEDLISTLKQCTFTSFSMTLEAVSLKQSTLTPEGAMHKELFRLPFQGIT